MLRKLIGLALVASLSFGVAPAMAAPKVAGTACVKLGATKVSSSYKYTCVKQGKKLVWNAGVRVVKLLTLTPAPLVSGTPRAGETLTADSGSWDAGVALSYQWLADGLVVTSEDQASFYLTENEVGKRVSVRVTGSKSGFTSVSRVSSPTPIVAADIDTPEVPDLQDMIKTPTPSVNGLATVGSILSVSAGVWDDDVTLSYRWNRNGTPIPGENDEQHVVSSDDSGALVSVTVTGTKDGFKTVSRTSGSLAIQAILRDFSISPAPVILGTAQVGKTLSAITGTWSPAPNFTYQWKRNGLAVGRDEQTYTLQDADLNAVISVVVSGSQQGFRTITRESEATSPVVAGSLVVRDFVLSPIPLLAGKGEINQTLTLIPGTWDSGAILQAKWYRNGVEIAGEIGLSYRLSAADVGSRITASIKGSLDGYQTVTRMSQPTDPVLAMQFSSSSIPVISGLASTGQLLIVNAGNWDSGSTLTYQWFRAGNAVAGAVATSYLLTANDVGFTISVVVTATKDGYASLSRTSTSSPVVTQAQLASTPTPLISGSPLLSSTLTATLGAWDVGVSLAGQWKRNGVIIPGATSASYVLTSADIGAVITFELTGSKAGYPSVTKVSAATPTITAQTLSQTPTPTVSGNPTSDQTLTLNAGTWDSGVLLSYQWLRNGQVISGATSQAYSLTQADIASVIQVSVTGTKAGFTSVVRLSLPTAPITQAVLKQTSVPVITGTPILGSTLSASWGAWDSGVSVQGQWKRNGSNISGATSSSLILTTADLGSTISFALTGSKAGYPSVTQVSLPTVAISALTFTLSPVPVISGTPTTGQVLNLNAGIWDSGTILKYQWNRGGTPISGATGSSYLLGVNDVGLAISVMVTASKPGHEPLSRLSNETTPVIQAVFTATPAPVISGNPLLGSTLSASWAPWDSGVAMSYRWKRNGSIILGAVFTTYTPVAADIGATLTFELTGAKTGYTTVVKSSQPTAAITAETFVLSPAPNIVGTAMVLKTLTASIGTWDQGASLAYQWLRNGANIAGATGLSYQLVLADQGATISLRVTATKPNALPMVVTSNPTAVVVATQIVLQGTPSVSGTAAVGSMLIASNGVWDFGVTFTYQWRRGLFNIAGATSNQYQVTSGDLNSTISVVVTATLGTAVVSKTSANTSAVVLGVLQYSVAPGFYGEYVVGGQIYRTDGTWPSGTKLSYQWLSNGTPISGATNYIFYPTVATLGAKISLRLTASLSGYVTAVIDTAASPPIGPGTIGSFSVPLVTGTPKSGETLTLGAALSCSNNLSTPVTITYQWTRNGVPISGQTATSYLVVDADSGAQVALTATCSATGYVPRVTKSAAVAVLIVPSLPFITSVDESQVTKLKITWSGTLGNTYVFDLVNQSTNGGRKTCDANSCLWENLAGGTTYTINYSATASGGSKAASFTAKTYPRLTLSANIKSFTMQGDLWTIDYLPVPTWTYKFTWETYGLGTSQCTNGFTPDTNQSPISVRAWIRSGCAKILRIADGHGNTGEVVLGNYTQIAVPSAEISATLGSSNAASGSIQGFSYQFNHFYSLTSTTVKLFNAGGTAVVLPIAPTTQRTWGDAYQGGYQGLLYLTGVEAGSYTVKMIFVDRAGASTTITVGALTVT